MLVPLSETTNMNAWQESGWIVRSYNVPTLEAVMGLPGPGIDLKGWKDQERFERLELADEPIAERFRKLAAQWRAERGATSSISQMVVHPAYQQIINIGLAVVPLLLRELAREPDHWFWALRAITGGNPVKPEHRGDLMLMAQDWLRWAKEQGY